MELLLKRPNTDADTVISDLYINGNFFCNVLEDKDRGLFSFMPLEELKAKKIKTKTAIPYGEYEVALTFSNKFQTYLPLVMNVPAFDGIRMHAGNSNVDTDGCLLVGTKNSETTIKDSRVTLEKLIDVISETLKKEKVKLFIVHS